MSEIENLTAKLLKFRDDRDWAKFHNPKDVAISLSLEAAELLEHFQWKTDGEIGEYVKKHKQEISEELADVFNWVLILSKDLNIDIAAASARKIALNGKKYPIKKSKGKATKYTNL